MDAALRYAQARLSPPVYGQIAAEAAISTPKEYFEEVLLEYTSRRNFLVKALNNIPGVKCPMPGGAFYVMARIPVKDSDEFCRWLLEEFSLDNKTVMLAPAAGFYGSSGRGKNEVRIAYVLCVEDLKIAIQCLEEALKIYP